MADQSVLERARAAYRERDWVPAVAGFDAARGSGDVPAADLRALAAGHWWLGHGPECLSVLEDAFRRSRAEGADEDAADTALLLALLRITASEVTVGAAWARRARRLLEGLPDRPAHGFLTYLEASMGLEGEEPWSAAGVARMRELAETTEDPAVAALAAVVAGMHDLRAGDPVAGFAHLDEAMLSVVSGEVAPEWAGDVLCTTIHACHELADYRRMADWTRATEAWAADYGSDAVYAGVCRVHRLELKSAAGEWAGAEDALERTCTDLVVADPWIAGEGWYQLGELRRLRGDDEGARRAYGLAREAGIDPAPGEALLELDAGRPEQAWGGLVAALAGRDRLARARLLRPGVRIALALREPDEAQRLLDELEEDARDFATDGFRAWAEHARGMVALFGGDPDGALVSLHAALDRLRRLRLRWEQAHVLAWIAAAHEARGEDTTAAQVRADAQAILTALGAGPLPAVETGAEAAAAIGPLTEREGEILGHVARGEANREIAEQLFISEKTVGRHLANIYLKLGVSSRTAAAAWWHDAAGGPGAR